MAALCEMAMLAAAARRECAPGFFARSRKRRAS